MTFENLPVNIKELPLTDRRLAADVIDLIISGEARADGCLGIMVCDEHDRGVLPIVLSDVPHDGDIEAVATLFDLVLPLVVERGGSLLVGRGRPRGGVLNDVDRAWHQQAIDSCAAHDVPLLGFYLATRDGVFPLPEPLAAAS
ncbi:hypothetical protein BA895_19185 [Humibacillus sp. DSM 29435]|uniref:hypothetical protein n=1 Tax=Humibacillus sp. DSM 29435 TaxID=1869167 RepID=UPI0008731B21|nr:hypothetical protein [Humibacillus sp. DSM 29435]OFE16440.1 hypothetical protein BA895_19185 [Humibacillus sp. DSM 29435]